MALYTRERPRSVVGQFVSCGRKVLEHAPHFESRASNAHFR